MIDGVHRAVIGDYYLQSLVVHADYFCSSFIVALSLHVIHKTTSVRLPLCEFIFKNNNCQ